MTAAATRAHSQARPAPRDAETLRREAFARKQAIAFRWLAPSLILGLLGSMSAIFTAAPGPGPLDDAPTAIRLLITWASPALFVASLLGLVLGLGIEDRENQRRDNWDALNTAE